MMTRAQVHDQVSRIRLEGRLRMLRQHRQLMASRPRLERSIPGAIGEQLRRSIAVAFRELRDPGQRGLYGA